MINWCFLQVIQKSPHFSAMLINNINPCLVIATLIVPHPIVLENILLVVVSVSFMKSVNRCAWWTQLYHPYMIGYSKNQRIFCAVYYTMGRSRPNIPCHVLLQKVRPVGLKYSQNTYLLLFHSDINEGFQRKFNL